MTRSMRAFEWVASLALTSTQEDLDSMNQAAPTLSWRSKLDEIYIKEKLSPFLERIVDNH